MIDRCQPWNPTPVPAHIQGDDTNLDLRLLVSPASGRFIATKPDDYTTEGEVVMAGALLGHVVRNDRTEAVVSPWSGLVMSHLVRSGDPVERHRPLVVIHPVDS